MDGEVDKQKIIERRRGKSGCSVTVRVLEIERVNEEERKEKECSKGRNVDGGVIGRRELSKKRPAIHFLKTHIQTY